MQFVQLIMSPYENYSYGGASNVEMGILGLFLTDDVGCIYPSPFAEWVLNEKSQYACSNATALKKENNFILLTDLYDEEETPTELRMTRQQFVQVITDWQEKVCKLKPKEVLIKHESGEFIIETKS